MLPGLLHRLTIKKVAVEFFATEIRAWHGEEPLRKVFWGYGVGTSVAIAMVYMAAIYAGRIALQQVLLVFSAAYTIGILISVWRCADNTNEKRWSLLARLLTVAWAGNITMALIFLQFDLLVKYLDR